MQSVPAPDGQALPFGFSPAQVPPRHVFPAAQSAATEQDVLHLAPPQAYTPHEVATGAAQVPLPSHDETPVYLPALQDSGAQVFCVVALRQAPLPSQVPSRPQAVPSAWQSFPCMTPDLTELHWPLPWPVLAAKHDVHLPVQPPSQQTPSTQFPVKHSLPIPQVLPRPF
jgi:hypothetical protein